MILVLQHRKDRLPDFLTTLANHPPVTVGGGHGDDADAAQILDTMQNLLLYWYMYLEFRQNIDFTLEYGKVVEENVGSFCNFL